MVDLRRQNLVIIQEHLEIAEEKKSMFHPKSEIQKKMGRIAIMADGAHAMGAVQNGKKMWSNCRFYKVFSFML